MPNILDEMKLPVSEMFTSVQGEGVNVGKPSLFIRLGTCNLTCSWCDAWYTWDQHHISETAKELGTKWKGPDWKVLSFTQILDYTAKVQKESNIKHCIITGGEPLVHKQKLPILVSALKPTFDIEWETNGTIFPGYILDMLTTWYDVSPKLKSSNQQKDEDRIVREAMAFFAGTQKAFFKFVVTSREDVEEMKRDYLLPFEIPRSKVLLMPEGTEEKVLDERGLWVAEVCKKEGYRFSPRLQIHLYGNKRGT